MKTLPLYLLRYMEAACLLLLVGAADAAELKVICANGMQPVFEVLVPKFERASGHNLQITFATGGTVIKRVVDGEVFDVVIATQPGIDTLVKAGRAQAAHVSAIASTGISVATRKGATKPDISSPALLKRALLAAKSITYLDPKDGGASGVHFAKVLDRLAITDEMKAKTILAPKVDAIGTLVATGEAEIGILQFQLFLGLSDIEVIGPLPGELQNTTVFSSAILGTSKEDVASKALITYLRTPEAVAVVRAKGMEPASP